MLTVLQDPELGRTFYVVGTSHVSPSSAYDVRRVMRSVQPDAVVVELCRSRVATMFPPEGEGEEPAPGPSRPPLNVADALASFRKFGPTAALAALLVGAVQGTAAAASGRSAGGEFRAAAEEALALDAEIILGDRPLEITFRRLVASLSPRQLLALAGAMSKAIASGKAAEGVQGPSDLRVEEAIRSLREWCPPLERVLLAERDTYLVWSLRYSRASLPCRSIVGVVGAGHVPGIVAGWDAPDARRRTELLEARPAPPAPLSIPPRDAPGRSRSGRPGRAACGPPSEEEGSSAPPGEQSRAESRVEYEYQDGTTARDLGMFSPRQAAEAARRAGLGAWAGHAAAGTASSSRKRQPAGGAAALGTEVGRFWAAVGSPGGGPGGAGEGAGSPRRHVFKQRRKKRRGSDGSEGKEVGGQGSPAAATARPRPGTVPASDDGSLATTQGSASMVACEHGVVVLMEMVGKGTNGRVYRGRLGERTVAVKRVSLAGATAKVEKLARLEIAMLSQLKHPNIVEYYGTAYDAAGMQHIDMIMEFVEGCTLSDFVSRRGSGLPEPEAARLVAQILDGLAYLHSKRIIHRDLKPANVIVTPDLVVKIIDFGVSAQLRDLAALRRSCVGTPWYLAPEVICLEQYSYQADCWSLGCSLAELLTGHRVYEDFNAVACMFRMVNDPHPPIPPSASPACAAFLQACFTRNWRDRPTAEQLRRHPFITSNL
eukprot:tig00021135_g18951.t1